MQVTKIRGSYRVIDENGKYARYTEEEFQALYGQEALEPELELDEVVEPNVE